MLATDREKDSVICHIRAQSRVREAVSTLGRFVVFGVEEKEHAASGLPQWIQSSTNFLSLNVCLESRSSPMATDQTVNYKQLPVALGTGSQVDENLVIQFMIIDLTFTKLQVEPVALLFGKLYDCKPYRTQKHQSIMREDCGRHFPTFVYRCTIIVSTVHAFSLNSRQN